MSISSSPPDFSVYSRPAMAFDMEVNQNTASSSNSGLGADDRPFAELAREQNAMPPAPLSTDQGWASGQPIEYPSGGTGVWAPTQPSFMPWHNSQGGFLG
jgi:hypothetical protein